MKRSVLCGDRLASQAPWKGMGKQSRHSSSDSLAFSYTLYFSFKKLDWTWYATATEENQSFHPLKFTPRWTKSCDMADAKWQGSILVFWAVLWHLYLLICIGVWAVQGKMWILHGEDRSLTLSEEKVSCLLGFSASVPVMSELQSRAPAGRCSTTKLVFLCFAFVKES